MPIVLGIHNGHDSSCAISCDGNIVSAISQERVTRIRHDGQEGLSNYLPLNECLSAASLSLHDVDLIVSSFQAQSPGGSGFHRPLVEANFGLFDPNDSRHTVISHHLAHSYSTFCTSGFDNAAVLVHDLGGSTSFDGGDFLITFREFEKWLNSTCDSIVQKTETISIYAANDDGIKLKDREYCVPHSQPDVFAHSIASLYDNVSRFVFGREHAHGQLMALGAFALDNDGKDPREIVKVAGDTLTFRNNWQNDFRKGRDPLEFAGLARSVQEATETGLLFYANKARRLCGYSNLCVAGGAFLNILSNALISRTGMFERFYVPSAPNDAGIAIGCALAGHHSLTNVLPRRRISDRLGSSYTIDALAEHVPSLFSIAHSVSPTEVAKLINQGEIIARFAGRAEFGPRSLGGRSLLANPLLPSSKTRLNDIKGRQAWRPVAPIIPKEVFTQFFEGECDAPYMSFAQEIKIDHRNALRALWHPDNSTRAQILDRNDDPWLYDLLFEFQRLTGYPILVNTSFNGPNRPIIEEPVDALSFVRQSKDIGYLLFDEYLIRRDSLKEIDGCILPADTVATMSLASGYMRILLVRGEKTFEISHDSWDVITNLIQQGTFDIDELNCSDIALKEIFLAGEKGLLNI